MRISTFARRSIRRRPCLSRVVLCTNLRRRQDEVFFECVRFFFFRHKTNKPTLSNIFYFPVVLGITPAIYVYYYFEVLHRLIQCEPGVQNILLRPVFTGAESGEKSERFVATFGRKLSSITLCTLVMGRGNFRARDWWNAEACWFNLRKFRSPPRSNLWQKRWNDVSAVVTLIPEKVATSWKEFPPAKTFRAAHTCRSRQRRAGDGVYGWVSIKTS